MIIALVVFKYAARSRERTVLIAPWDLAVWEFLICGSDKALER